MFRKYRYKPLMDGNPNKNELTRDLTDKGENFNTSTIVINVFVKSVYGY